MIGKRTEGGLPPAPLTPAQSNMRAGESIIIFAIPRQNQKDDLKEACENPFPANREKLFYPVALPAGFSGNH